MTGARPSAMPSASCAVARVPNPNRCYLGPNEVKLLGLDEEYAAALRRRAAQKEKDAERERNEKTTIDRKRIA
jgi:hypothetical protein